MKSFFEKVLAFGLLILMGIGVWKLLHFVWLGFSSLDGDIATAIVTGLVTFFITLVSVILGKYFERKLIIEKELRDKKIPVYNEFIDFFINLLTNHEKMSENELQEFFSKITKELIIWGSDEVISKWSSYRIRLVNNSLGAQNDASLKVMMVELEELLKAIRKDTGHKNSKIKKGDILKMFINDVE